MDFHFLACSGAETENLLPFFTAGSVKPENGEGQVGDGQFHELPQLDQGFLDANTTMVVFSIGGNDMKFEAVIKHCLSKAFFLPLSSCATYPLDGDTQPLETTSQTLMNDVLPESLETVITQIRLKAPNAKIVLAGYPKLFESGGTCFFPGIGSSGDWLNGMSDDLSAVMEGVADDMTTTAQPVLYADPQEYFAGHNVCGSEPWIHNLVFTFTPGDRSKFGSIPWPGDDVQIPVSNQSFHPKFRGATAYAYAMSEALGIPVSE